MDSGTWWIWFGLVVVGIMVFVWLRSVPGRHLKQRLNIWQTEPSEDLERVERDRRASLPIEVLQKSEPLGLRKRILQWFQVVDEEELATLQTQFESQRAELVARIDRLEFSLTRQGRFEQWASEVNARLSHIELSQGSQQKKGNSQPSHAKSFLCLGVRVTLTDRIWDELGMGRSAKLSDSEIATFIQGPFCRNCLHSLVIQDSTGGEKSVRAQCRYCSLAWREESSSPLLLRDIKREAFEYLDAAYRNKRVSEE